MKKQLLFLVIFLLVTNISLGQRTAVIFSNNIFKGVYSEVYQQPLTIIYDVLCSEGNISRNGLDFYVNDSIKTSDDSDYVNNVYDKGHLAPAADFNCDKDNLFKTFSYLNCALQHQDLNRGVWRYLEAHERELSKNGKVTVKVEVMFSKKSKKLSTGATIPDGFKKTIYVNDVMVECYYFPNTQPKSGKKYSDYKIKCN